MTSRRGRWPALAQILGLSELQIELLVDKITGAEIQYQSASASAALRWAVRTLLSTGRNSAERATPSPGVTLLCVSQASAENSGLRTNLQKLFMEEQSLWIEPMDFTTRHSVQAPLKAIGGLLRLHLRKLFAPQTERQLIDKLSLPYVQALIQAARLAALKPKKIIWVGNSYALPTFFLSAWFKSTNVMSCYYVNRAFVSHQDNLAAHEVLLGNRWALQVYECAGAKFDADRIMGFHNIFFPAIRPARQEEAGRRKDRVAIYCSGAYARMKLEVHTADYLEQELEEEELFLHEVRGLASSLPEISFTLFYHPSVETHETAREHYREVLKLANVALNPAGVRSSQCHHLYEVGISRGSNVIFERLEAGHKALFTRPIRQIKEYRASQLAPVIIDGEALDAATLKKFLDMPLNGFHSLIGFLQEEMSDRPSA